MKFIIGKKLNMTQIFQEDGTVVPVTRVKAGPCQVVQIKNVKKDKVNSVQISFGQTKEKRLAKPQLGHLKELNKTKILHEFKLDEGQTKNLERGDMITVETFVQGDRVKVSGNSKGKGFAGVVKRYNFKCGPASHGHKDQLRMPGSIGATGPQRVFKGTRMGGRMGGNQVTVNNLEIIEVHPESNELCIKGAVPGARNGLLLIKCDGELNVQKNIKTLEQENLPTGDQPMAGTIDGDEKNKEELKKIDKEKVKEIEVEEQNNND